MKKFIVPVLSVCFFISCSTDDAALNTVETTTDSASDIKITEKSLTNFSNPANPFDYIGELHREILIDYVQNYGTRTTFPGVVNNVDGIAVNNTDFASISGDYDGLYSATVQWTMNNIDNLGNIMNKAGLSENGKIVMNDFIGLIDALEPQPLTNAFSAVKSFENTVMNNQSLTAVDEQVILSAASVARYSIGYYGDKRKWFKTKTSVIASAGTASTPEAITMSVNADLLAD